MSADPAAALAIEQTSEGRSDRLAGLFDAHEDRLYRLARRLSRSADQASSSCDMLPVKEDNSARTAST